MKYCTKCGKPNEDENRFCASCGEKFIIFEPKQFNDNVISGDVDMSTVTNIVNNYNGVNPSSKTVDINNFLKLMFISLEDGDWDHANAYCVKVLEQDPENAHAFLGKLMIDLKVKLKEDLDSCNAPFDNNNNYKRAIRFGDEKLISFLKNQADAVRLREEQRKAKETRKLEEARKLEETRRLREAEERRKAEESQFDVFICYKETDSNGNRTLDSVIAQDVYGVLKKEGFKVFYAPITLEDKLGSEYEPYILDALNSAKVMIVIGTKPEYFNAVWVKNEWSRYLALIKQGQKKILIPAYKVMNPYDLPDEFDDLTALDMSRIGFIQDMIRGIKRYLNS